MAEALEELKREAKAVSSAPIFVGALTMVLIVLIWFVVHWSYRSVLSNKNSYIASLERRVADYRETLNGASPEQARRRIEAMELELKTLHIRLAPRRLTAAQRESIADRSRLPPGAQSRSLTVMVQENCSDCPAFAAEIVAALRLSDNWTVSSQRLTHVEVHPRSGLGIRVADPTRPPPEAVILQQALRSAGLAFNMLRADAGSDLELLVTERLPQ